MTYTSYKDHQAKNVAEHSEGYYQRSGNNYKTEAAGVKTVQNSKVRMIIDSANKVISLTEPTNLSPNLPSAQDLTTLLQNVKALKKKKDKTHCTYRVEFNKNTQYEAYEFTVGEKGLLEKAVYYYSERSYKDYGESGDEDPIELKVKPRMDVLFENYAFPIKTKESDFSETGISFREQNKVILSDPYKTYSIRDYRAQAKN